ncbi:MAG: LysM peptidoglycan-binding domain-containing protein [Alphaproteobacteria bacterium]|nr:LysM peptidoglycan-binding domain-containing protein [Alphaproteobacteria bacterium]MBN2675240.1 LysM peptidoglycan-binding domain-containing protein [Alphaproteobacteria bacterium]
MAKKINKSARIGKTKISTDDMIDGAIARQNSWMSRRRDFAKSFLKKLNIFARPTNAAERKAKIVAKEARKLKRAEFKKESRSGIMAYWFPIFCSVIVIAVGVWVAFIRSDMNVVKESKIVIVPSVPEPVVKEVKEAKEIIKIVNEKVVPSFDIVRIEPDGDVVIAGRWLPQQNISIVVNKKVVATERTDMQGEFVYAPKHTFKPGNYTIGLIGSDDTKSKDNVFIYISERGYANSISLLMTKDGSKLLQSPKLVDGDLSVSKIDYLESGRIVITGNALPRLRVSLTLNDKYLGFAHVSDHKYFGIGADVEKLEPGKEYNLVIRLHDGDGKTVSEIKHKFIMPIATGTDDTFYTVRRGDCLWIIARNFLRKGVLFSIIAEKNNIKNPNLIFPKQTLQIPIKTQ